MNKIVIINYKFLKVGGIENYIYQVVKRYLEAGVHIIWMRRKKLIISDLYKKIMTDENKVKSYLLTELQIQMLKKIPLENISQNDEIVILSFSCQDHARALKIKKDNRRLNIKALYLIPHFTGSVIYPEQDFFIFRKNINSRMSLIYKKWIEAGNILFFSEKHINAIKEAYRITIRDEYKRLVPAMTKPLPEFEEEEVAIRYRQRPFKIVAASRFDFPHKGFMIGLIREFPRIKDICPDAILYLVGEGAGIGLIEDEISMLDLQISKDIHILGMMSREDLINFYKTCHLSISVAGCASLSAGVGVITLPARHHTYNCEVYGFLPESKECFLETKPGNPVVPYIKKLLSMSEQEYVECSKNAYLSKNGRYTGRKDVDTKMFFEMKYDSEYKISKADLYYITYISVIGKILHRIKKL